MKLISNFIWFLVLCSATVVCAQEQPTVTESGNTIEVDNQVLDGIYEENTISDSRPLAYDYIHEKDVFWKQRIWRVIDTRDKFNRPFSYPVKGRALVEIIMQEAQNGNINLFEIPYKGIVNPKDGWNDFKDRYEPSKISELLVKFDTARLYNRQTEEYEETVTKLEFQPADVERFLVKEDWVFDEERSRLEVRVIGICPLRQIDIGGRKFDEQMFWVYYPHARQALAKHTYYNPQNGASTMSWADVFEARHFSSYITKKENKFNRKIEQMIANPRDRHIESDRIREGIFNFEHDLWEY